jgi:hypothetical protein
MMPVMAGNTTSSFILPSHKKTPTVSVAKGTHWLFFACEDLRLEPQKNRQLQRERGVALRRCGDPFLTGPLAVWNPNTLKYLGQKIFVVELRGYAHIVPSRETEKEIL